MTIAEDTSSTAAAPKQAAPHIQTELPGPRARELIARDEAVASPSLTRAYPLVAESGSGVVVTDVDGNRFLDFAAGIAVASTGHSHPKVVAAIKEQADRLIHIAATDFYEPRYTEFMERLAAIAPFEEKARVFLTNSGTEAVEGAIKLARYHTHRPGIIAFEGAFHGRTMGALSLTNSKIKQRAGFGPLIPMVHHSPFPRVRAWHEGSGGDGSAELEVLRRSILGRLIAPSDVAAIVVEPIQGEGGYFPAPKAFMEGLREICDEHGILLIADEIQSGMGRTGTWWAIQHTGVEPDIITSAKGIASGMPIGAFIARDSVWTWPPGAHGSTFAGNPICAAAGLATLDIIES
ncbi:MAG TPA: aminotransferase class III-fold pyridoxal phosphate-dependent enzyme, partial [Candidatus Limnocylindria bacterium]